VSRIRSFCTELRTFSLDRAWMVYHWTNGWFFYRWDLIVFLEQSRRHQFLLQEWCWFSSRSPSNLRWRRCIQPRPQVGKRQIRLGFRAFPPLNNTKQSNADVDMVPARDISSSKRSMDTSPVVNPAKQCPSN
jgi:hypothetical protein